MDRKQLLLAKYLLLKSQDLYNRDDITSGGLAISVCQDAVEILVWTIAKEFEADVKDKEPFTKVLESIESAKKNQARAGLPHKAKILELNSARVNFKHYGNLPAADEVEKFMGYAEGCLREGMKVFFEVDFDTLSLADLVTDTRVKEKLKLSEQLLIAGSYKESCAASSHAEAFIALHINRLLLPRVDSNMRSLHFDQATHGGLDAVIGYIANYLDQLRILGISGVLRLNPIEYLAFKRIAPGTSIMAGGNAQTYYHRTDYSREEAQFCLSYATKVALIVQQLRMPKVPGVTQEL